MPSEIVRATSGGGSGLPGGVASYVRDPMADDLDAAEYDITNLGAIATMVNGLVHLNGGTPAAAGVLPAAPVLGGALLSDVLTWAAEVDTWNDTLRTLLLDRGIVKGA